MPSKELFAAGEVELTPDPIGTEESLFDFIARRSGEFYSQKRDYLNLCFSRWPAGQRESIASRLRDSDSRQARSAIFEFMVADLLHELGLDFSHPEASSEGESVPDLLFEDGSGVSIAIECTVVGPDEARYQKNLSFDRLVDGALAKVTTRCCRFGFRLLKAGGSTPRSRSLGGFLESIAQESDGLFFEDLISIGDEIGPRLFDDRKTGWRLVIDGRYEGPSMVKAGERMWLSKSTGAWYDNTSQRIRERVKQKVKQHSAREEPLIVAIAPADYETLSTRTMLDAIRGDTGFSYAVAHDQFIPLGRFRKNALWTIGGNGWQRRSPVAVMAWPSLFPPTLRQHPPSLWLNPSLSSPVLSDWPFRTVHLCSGEQCETNENRAVTDVFQHPWWSTEA